MRPDEAICKYCHSVVFRNGQHICLEVRCVVQMKDGHPVAYVDAMSLSATRRALESMAEERQRFVEQLAELGVKW